jgi:hypothetical protein
LAAPRKVTGMASGDGEQTSSAWASRGPEARVARPERPALSDRTPPPVRGKAAVPLALRRSQTMGYLSVAILFFSVVIMVMTRSSLVSNLTELLHDQDTTVSETRLADAAPMVVYVAIGALLLVAIPEWVVATQLLRRRAWPRGVLVPVAILHVLVAFLCAILIPLTGWQGWLLVVALIFSGLLALVASVRAFAPPVTRWLRSRRNEETTADG